MKIPKTFTDVGMCWMPFSYLLVNCFTALLMTLRNQYISMEKLIKISSEYIRMTKKKFDIPNLPRLKIYEHHLSVSWQVAKCNIL